MKLDILRTIEKHKFILALALIAICLISLTVHSNNRTVNTNSIQPIPNPHEFLSADAFCQAAGYDWSLGMHTFYGHLEEWLCLDVQECVVKIIFRIDGLEEPWIESSCPHMTRREHTYVWINRHELSQPIEIQEGLKRVCKNGSMEAVIPIIDAPLKEINGRIIRTGLVICQEGNDLVMRDGRRTDHREMNRWEDIQPIHNELRTTDLAHDAHNGITHESHSPSH